MHPPHLHTNTTDEHKRRLLEALDAAGGTGRHDDIIAAAAPDNHDDATHLRNAVAHLYGAGVVTVRAGYISRLG